MSMLLYDWPLLGSLRVGQQLDAALIPTPIPLFPLQTYNELFQEMMTEDQVLSMVAKSQEFEQIKAGTIWLWCAEPGKHCI